MARLGVLYALTEEELEKLCKYPLEERYDYMLNEIEEELLGTLRGYELDKAWEGIQYCLGNGQWNEENIVPTNIIFGGEFLVDTDDNIITLKDHNTVEKIVDFLCQNDIQEIIQNNFPKIDEEEYGFPKDEDNLNYLLGWSEGLLGFYENAQKENYQVIFTVDL